MTFAADDPRHQDFEVNWWGDCVNTLAEETKQLTYAPLMGLIPIAVGDRRPVYDIGRRRVVDVGGGPVSLLLKCAHIEAGSTVIDPGSYPAWTQARYEYCGIRVIRERAETALERLEPGSFDEAWCYNVLQHVVDPERIVAGMRRAARVVRVFEWVWTAATLGHPHVLNPVTLDQWLDGTGKILKLSENDCVGWSYSGVFAGRH